jgi:multidrug efflux system membrane fusion protein
VVVLATPEPPAGGVSGRLGTGTVAGVSAAVDSTSGGVEIRVVVPSPTRMLKVGEEISGRITVAVHPNAVAVPLAALVPGDEGQHVFVVDANDIAHERPVTVGERSDVQAEILEGLAAGERIVVEGAYGVADGAEIQSEDEAAAAERADSLHEADSTGTATP